MANVPIIHIALPSGKSLCKGTTFPDNDKGKHFPKFYYFGGSAVCRLPHFSIP